MNIPCHVITMLLLIGTLSACGTATPDMRLLQAEQRAGQGHLKALAVHSQLPIQAWGRIQPNTVTHVYIEGDGHAWRGNRRPSLDPTPYQPVALTLAAADSHGSVLYVGRPCQYQMDAARGCHFSVWTDRRFAEIADIKAALQQLTAQQPLVLIGFSGGANIVVQLAAQLPQVQGVISVAGNLDSASFSQFHHLAKESYGQNAQLLTQLAQLPQLHYTGTADRIIPPALTHQQLAGVSRRCVQIITVPHADHHGPWHIDWSAFNALQQQCQR